MRAAMDFGARSITDAVASFHCRLRAPKRAH